MFWKAASLLNSTWDVGGRRLEDHVTVETGFDSDLLCIGEEGSESEDAVMLMVEGSPLDEFPIPVPTPSNARTVQRRVGEADGCSGSGRMTTERRWAAGRSPPDTRGLWLAQRTWPTAGQWGGFSAQSLCLSVDAPWTQVCGAERAEK